MVGPTRVELVTSRLSGVRSNHLSYEPFHENREKSQGFRGVLTESQTLKNSYLLGTKH
jgi:hypothetical protein